MATQPPIADYDDKNADQVTERLRKLSQADLAKLEAYERDSQARRTVLDAIASLREREPWSGYDDMEVEEVNAALRERDGRAAARVLEYERRHKRRGTVIEYAEGRRETASGGSERGAAPRSKRRPTTSRKRSARSGSTAKAASEKRQSGSSPRSGSKTKARGSSRKANGASRGGSSRSSDGSSPSKSSASTRARPSSGSRGGSSRSSRSSRGSSGSSRSSRGSSRPNARGGNRSRANSQRRNGMLATVKDAAGKATGPALAVGAVAAGVAGGVALKSRGRHKKVLGVPVPRAVAKPGLLDLDTKAIVQPVGKASRRLRQTSKSVAKQMERVGEHAERVVKSLG